MTAAPAPSGSFDVVDVVVLAGGGSRRLGGTDKARLLLDGERLVDRVVRAARSVGARVVVVGPADLDVDAPVTRERPPGGGPVAAIAAGLVALAGSPGRAGPAAEVLVLACDLVRPDDVVTMLTARGLGDADGVHLVDPAGAPQWLAGRYRRTSLECRLRDAGDPPGGAVRALLAGLDLVGLPAGADVVADVDTWEQARRAGAGGPHRAIRPDVEPGRTSSPPGAPIS